MASGNEKSLDDIVKFIEESAAKKPEQACKAMFYFLYKEILVNRVAINEAGPDANRAAVEHSEKLINELNKLLMEQFK